MVVDEERVGDVPGDHCLLCAKVALRHLQVIETVDDVDALALRTGIGLHDPVVTRHFLLILRLLLLFFVLLGFVDLLGSAF